MKDGDLEKKSKDLEIQTAKYDVELISYYLLSSASNNNFSMDLERSQKILYYLQAKYMHQYNRALFLEDIIAWENGPLVEESFNALAKEVFNSRKDYTFIGYMDDWIEETDRIFIDKVINTFKGLSTLELSIKTREEDPWLNNYIKSRKNIIPREEIRDYFQRDLRNTSRLYAVYKDLDTTQIVNELNKNPRINYSQDREAILEFDSYINSKLESIGLSSQDFHQFNDILGYVCDYLMYREKIITLEVLQCILFFFQILFLKKFQKPCFNEFIYKDKDSVIVGKLPYLYKLEARKVDDYVLMEREFNYSKEERDYLAQQVRLKLIQTKANPYAREKFSPEELELMDMILNKLTDLRGFQVLNLVQGEESWIKTRLNEAISVDLMYNL